VTDATPLLELGLVLFAAALLGAVVVLGLGVAAGAIGNGAFSAALAAAVVSIALSAVAVRLFPTAARSARRAADQGFGVPSVSIALPASGGAPRLTVFLPRDRYARQARPVTASRCSEPST